MDTPFDTDLSGLSAFAPELAVAIARVASDVALVIDGEGVIRNVADRPSPMVATREEWVGQRWVDTATGSTRRSVELLLEEVRSRGVARRREVTHTGPGGDEVPLTWAAIRLGGTGQVLAVGRDLRALAAIQRRMFETRDDMERQYWGRRQAENRYRLLFHVASDGVLVLDAATLQVQEANTAATTLLGMGAGALTGQPLPEGLPAGARAVVTDLLINARASGRTGEIRVRALAGAGALDISATPFRADGRQHMLVRARRDESDGRDSRLLSTMAEFVESTPDAVVITDSVGRILMANPAFVQLARFDDESLVRGRLLDALLGERGLAEGPWHRLVSAARASGIVSHELIDVHLPGAGAFAVDASAALMTEGDQVCIGLTLRHRVHAPPAQPADELQQDLLALTRQVGRVPLTELLSEVTHRAERHLIAVALRRSGGQHAAAAEALGLSPESLELRMRRHGLPMHGFAAADEARPTFVN